LMDREQRDLVLEQDVGLIWREERVSCPHEDLLRAWVEGGLEAGPGGFVAFHVETARCPWCSVKVQEIREAREGRPVPEKAVEKATEKALRSTFLGLRRK